MACIQSCLALRSGHVGQRRLCPGLLHSGGASQGFSCHGRLCCHGVRWIGGKLRSDLWQSARAARAESSIWPTLRDVTLSSELLEPEAQMVGAVLFISPKLLDLSMNFVPWVATLKWSDLGTMVFGCLIDRQLQVFAGVLNISFRTSLDFFLGPFC